MSEQTIAQIKEDLKKYPDLLDSFYCRGYLITTHKYDLSADYPFYSQWQEQIVKDDSGCVFYFYTHKRTKSYIYQENGICFFLVGHAYNPFKMQYDEIEILKELACDVNENSSLFWEKESELTGVFCIGYISGNKITVSTDAVGMQMVYYGRIGADIYLTSHSQLVSDLCGLTQDPYVQKLVASRFYHYWGTWLPGDLGPYKEMKRLQPNFYATMEVGKQDILLKRYYPLTKVVESEDNYTETIGELGKIMSNSMCLIAKKWKSGKKAISVTGGRDSLTTLACAKEEYDKYNYFSFISKSAEKVDALAASTICKTLGLSHEIYDIPENYGDEDKIRACKNIIDCNGGYTGSHNLNEIRKRLFFIENHKFDLEVKSWINEIGRGWYYNKYDKESFPNRPSPSFLRSMYKIIFSPVLIHKTDKIFKEYLETYYSGEVFDNLSWLELIYWEFAWAGNEGISLNAEHRIAYEIIIPFNNRKYLDLMLRVPVQKRKKDCIPDDLIRLMNPKISETNIKIKDADHTISWTMKLRIYLEVMSRVKF